MALEHGVPTRAEIEEILASVKKPKDKEVGFDKVKARNKERKDKVKAVVDAKFGASKKIHKYVWDKIVDDLQTYENWEPEKLVVVRKM